MIGKVEEDSVADALQDLESCVERTLGESAYHHVDTESLFAGHHRRGQFQSSL